MNQKSYNQCQKRGESDNFDKITISLRLLKSAGLSSDNTISTNNTVFLIGTILTVEFPHVLIKLTILWPNEYIEL